VVVRFKATLKRPDLPSATPPWRSRRTAKPSAGLIATLALIIILAGFAMVLLSRVNRPMSGGPQASPSAAFLEADTLTRGDWQGKYGSAGFALAGGGKNLPLFAEIGLPGTKNTSSWVDTTTDARALRKVNADRRIAAAWYGFSAFSVDVNLKDDKTHRLSLSVVDWDSDVRVENIEILNGVSRKLLDFRQLSRFAGGQYLVWSVSGHVIIRVVPVAGANAVFSGCFLD
jgi:hypothetical protein